MNSGEIGKEVQDELNKLIQVYGVDKIEFSIAMQVSTVTPVAKTTIWYNLNPNEIRRIYDGCCNRFKLTHDEKLAGQYIYIKLLF
jgi:hypothetical protein